MKPVTVSIPHSLGKAEALARLKAGLAQSTASIPLIHIAETNWVDNRMTFRAGVMGQTATGSIDVEDTFVRVEILLPTWLASLGNKISDALAAKGRLLLTKR
jgi:hypothetical protein